MRQLNKFLWMLESGSNRRVLRQSTQVPHAGRIKSLWGLNYGRKAWSSMWNKLWCRCSYMLPIHTHTCHMYTDDNTGVKLSYINSPRCKQYDSVQFGPLIDWVVTRTWETIQQRSSSSLSGKGPLWVVLALADMSTFWCSPSTLDGQHYSLSSSLP